MFEGSLIDYEMIHKNLNLMSYYQKNKEWLQENLTKNIKIFLERKKKRQYVHERYK